MSNKAEKRAAAAAKAAAPEIVTLTSGKLLGLLTDARFRSLFPTVADAVKPAAKKTGCNTCSRKNSGVTAVNVEVALQRVAALSTAQKLELKRMLKAPQLTFKYYKPGASQRTKLTF